MSASVAAVAIGRNEGDRLIRCLTTLTDQLDRIVYVDSGSTDGSVQAARDLVGRIDREALAQKRPVTRRLAAEVLGQSELPDLLDGAG